MRLDIYHNVNDYSTEVMAAVARHEIQNNLIIGNCLRGKAGADTSRWLMVTVKERDGGLQLVALMTPPFNLVLYETNNIRNDAALTLLTKELTGLQASIPGVVAEKSLAGRFATEYALLSGKTKREGMKMRIYRLDRLTEVPAAPGNLRLATENDLHFLPYGNMAFNSDCGFNAVDLPVITEKVNQWLKDKTLHLWEDGIPVSQAAMGRKTLNGAVVNGVYTPPHYRRKGYATSCVAALSKQLIDSGCKFCCLFTDLANPVSNSIYQQIGYRPVGDYDEYKFA